MSTNVFAIQNRNTKAYFLFSSTEENCDRDASQLVSSKANNFFALCPEVSNYKVGVVEDFDSNVISEINAKVGEQYEDLKEDDYCMNTNMDKCIEMLNKKLSAKPKAAKKAAVIPSEPTKEVGEQPKAKRIPKPQPKPRGKKATISAPTSNLVEFN